VVRFIEDGSRYWFPVTEVERFLGDMQSSGRDAASDTIGQGSHDFAAQVLAGTLAAKKKASGMTSSSATAGAYSTALMPYSIVPTVSTNNFTCRKVILQSHFPFPHCHIASGV